MPHLQQLGYKIDLTSNAQMASSAHEGDWDAVLLSWNLIKEDVIGLYKKIDTQMKIPCLVFPEDPSRRSANALLKSKIPNVLFPPITSLGMHRRLQMLLRNRKRPAPGGEKVKEIEIKAVDVKTEIPWWERSQFQGKLEDYMGKTLTEIPRPAPSGIIRGPSALSRAVISRVAWGKVQGYLVCAYEDSGTDAAFVNHVRKSLLVQMTNKGISQHDLEESFEMDIAFVEFQSWVKEFAEILVADGNPGQQLVIGFVDTNSLPKVKKLEKEDYFSVELEGRLSVNTKLTFDLFFHLPANNRFIRYARRDSNISEDLLARMMRIGPNRFVLTPAECGSLFRYCIQTDLWSATPVTTPKSSTGTDDE